MKQLWGGLWRSENRLDGKTEHLLHEDGFPKLFHTRADARQWIKAEYGYIARRLDLQCEPHGWKMPIAVKVRIAPLQEDPKP